MGLKQALLRIRPSLTSGVPQEGATVTDLSTRLCLLLALTLSAPALAGARDAKAANPYGARSDEELTALAAEWDALDRQQRRALLTEMQLRMDRQGDGDGVLHIRTERRYGRIIRQSDGRVIRIETQVVQVRPVSPDDVGARQSFGVGFEHRAAHRQGPQSIKITTVSEGTLLSEAPAGSPLVEPPPMPLPVYQVVDPAP